MQGEKKGRSKSELQLIYCTFLTERSQYWWHCFPALALKLQTTAIFCRAHWFKLASNYATFFKKKIQFSQSHWLYSPFFAQSFPLSSLFKHHFEPNYHIKTWAKDTLPTLSYQPPCCFLSAHLQQINRINKADQTRFTCSPSRGKSACRCKKRDAVSRRQDRCRGASGHGACLKWQTDRQTDRLAVTPNLTVGPGVCEGRHDQSARASQQPGGYPDMQQSNAWK